MTLATAASALLSATVQLGPLVLLGVLYGVRVHRLAGRGRRTPAARQAAFYTGLLATAGTLTLLDGPSTERMYLHMVEHLVLADVASLLLVLGLTGAVIAPVLRTPPFSRLKVLAHPAVALAMWTLALCIWHVPALYEAALRDPAVHALQHVSFLGAGVCMWMCLFGPLPQPAWFGNLGRFLYIIALSVPGIVIGYALIWTSSALYPFYRHADLAAGITAASDQHTAGSLMMTEDTIMVIALLAWLLVRSIREGEERDGLMRLAERLDVDLSEERAARAVSSGQTGRLRRRLEQDARGVSRQEQSRASGGAMGASAPDGA